MKRFIALAVTAATAIAMTACVIEKRHAQDESPRNRQSVVTFRADSFEHVTLGGSVSLVYTQGPTDSIRIECAEEDKDGLEVEQSGNELRISQKGRQRGFWPGSSSKVVAYVSSPTLTSIDAGGACGIKMKEPVKFGDLSIMVSGASDIDIRDIAANALSVETSGASKVSIGSAAAAKFRVGISGAGKLEAKLHKSERVDVQVSGAGDIDLDLEECGEVKCEVSGAGNIALRGDARSVDASASGAGRVDKGDLRIGGGR